MTARGSAREQPPIRQAAPEQRICRPGRPASWPRQPAPGGYSGAGGGGSAVLARRGADNNQGPLATFYAGLLREIEADRRTLDQIATSAGTQPSVLKQAAAVAAERLSRFKIDHRMTGNPDLSLLLEFELLYLGIEGEHSLWRGLDVLNDSRLAKFDFGKLAARAREPQSRSSV